MINNILERITEKTADYQRADNLVASLNTGEVDRTVLRSLRRERRFHSREAQRLVSSAMSQRVDTNDIAEAVEIGIRKARNDEAGDT